MATSDHCNISSKVTEEKSKNGEPSLGHWTKIMAMIKGIAMKRKDRKAHEAKHYLTTNNSFIAMQTSSMNNSSVMIKPYVFTSDSGPSTTK